jgi:hypothetical protein
VNILNGPTSKNWDFGLFKNFRVPQLSEAAQIQFRAEFFNFTNTPHFGQPVSYIQSSAAGQILSAAPDPVCVEIDFLARNVRNGGHIPDAKQG